MSWVYLIMAIGCEVAGTTCMKLSESFTKLVPSILLFALYGVSLALLTLALKGIPVGVAYAVWAGLGTAVIAVIATIAFGEPLSASKIVCLALIITGVIGLNISGGGH
ncbi:MAG TPA: multidrug efflux SMR transporter [Pirellulales bacterium]|jgi:small multidrug resistance pump